MTRYLSNKQSSVRGALALCFTFLWQFVLGTLGMYPLPSAQAASTELGIAGGLTVIIQPAEAVADGARWSVDGGPQGVSGVPADGLLPGRHTVQFRNLPAWLEPEATEVLVIGGKQTTVTATYRPLPNFDIRPAPDPLI